MIRFSDISANIISGGFESTALEIFRFQASNCEPYRRYIQLLGVNANEVISLDKIPFLPIEIFRSHRVYCANSNAQLIFNSSGTTGDDTSTHYVASAELYTDSFLAGFKQFYGTASQYKLKTLLPSYREGSSLLYMIRELEKQCIGNRVMLIGVTFALLEAARSGQCERLPSGSIVIETGGMKGRDYQIERSELHRELCDAFGVDSIHSEYGMCELLSQAYSKGSGLFYPSSTMRVMGRRTDNPMAAAKYGEVSGLNVVDLSNYYSCSFIATGDRGVVYDNGSFEVLGRLEGEILRGCNML